MKYPALLMTYFCTCSLPIQAGLIHPMADKVANTVADKQASQVPDCEKLTGMLGDRIEKNAIVRLLQTVDTDRLLEGYRKRPGRQSWDGEHIGKWLHAATLAWVYTGNAELRAKLDSAVVELIKCQQEDGYLGTYVEKDKWTEWDVWAHKYNLIGLITYMHYTGNREPLTACQKMGDLLCKTFGNAPGQRSIIRGNHVGMAPTSVLEPMTWLYRLTGEQRYRDFCEYILSSWETEEGPHIVSRLLNGQGVNKVGNGKAYEMLSCINGMLEWYRVSGDPKLLKAALLAWQDIVDKRLYVTGTCSSYEHFQKDHELVNSGNVGETCVTVTWLQFNMHLLRITGEARFAEQIERTAYNQLSGAQRPTGKGWGYYVQMRGIKPYSEEFSGHCCLSSGPRGFSLLPTMALTTDADGVVVNLYDPATATLALADRSEVKIAIQTKYPSAETIAINVAPQQPKTFALKLRIPAWCKNATLQVDGKSAPLTPGADGYVSIKREWKSSDVATLTLPLAPQIITGDHINSGKAMFTYGPLVLAIDAALSGGDNNPELPDVDLQKLKFTTEPAQGSYLAWPDAQVFHITIDDKNWGLAPFATAGCNGSRYRVWLRQAGILSMENLLDGGTESRSRQGNRVGSIIDGELVVTWDGKMADEDWFAVTVPKPITVGRIAFFQGWPHPDGGWFDTSAGKPKIQIKTTSDTDWKTVGELATYPDTTATSPGKIHTGEAYNFTFSSPIAITGIRVLGKPASGNQPTQAFAGCTGLKAYAQ